MIVKFVHLNFPCNLVGWAMFNLNGQVSTIIEAAELAWCDLSPLDSASFWCKHSWLGHCFVQRAGVSSSTFAFFSGVYTQRTSSIIKIAENVLTVFRRIWYRNVSNPCFFHYDLLTLVLISATDCSIAARGLGCSICDPFLAMWVAGKLPKAECWGLGRNALSDGLMGLGQVLYLAWLR